MKKWKKFIAMGLAVSMIVPSCIPQTLWASEFSAGSVESAADVFEDGAGYETGSESGNKISDENNSGDEFGTGELKDQEPEQSETEDSVNAGQSAEGYNILLYSTSGEINFYFSECSCKSFVLNICDFYEICTLILTGNIKRYRLTRRK